MSPISEKEFQDGMEYARALASKLAARRHCWSEYDDLVSEAYLGVLTARTKFDRERGAKFTTYAKFWIEQRMYRYLKGYNEITAHEGPSLDQFVGEEGAPDTTLGDLILPPDLFPEAMLLDRAFIERAWRLLTPRERQVLHQRFWLGMSLREIGDDFGHSRTWAQNVETAGLRKLRHLLVVQADAA